MSDTAKIDCVLGLIARLDSTDEFYCGTNGTRQHWTDNESVYHQNDEKKGIDREHKTKMVVTETCQTMVETYETFGIIPLRPYCNETTLVIGCGNGPIGYYGGILGSRCQDDILSVFFQYTQRHQHHGCYTIDAAFSANPSLVATFGKVDLRRFLPREIFNRIDFEGFMIRCGMFSREIGAYRDESLLTLGASEFDTENVCTISNLIHLLTDGGIVSLSNRTTCEKKNGTLRNILNPLETFEYDDPETYYRFAQL
jgi:hypothetical protein